jgi:hypothetical protein
MRIPGEEPCGSGPDFAGSFLLKMKYQIFENRKKSGNQFPDFIIQCPLIGCKGGQACQIQ